MRTKYIDEEVVIMSRVSCNDEVDGVVRNGYDYDRQVITSSSHVDIGTASRSFVAVAALLDRMCGGSRLGCHEHE